MGKISVLDCTLRDGGYCNQWSFGRKNIHKIINNLVAANVEIIECGFLTNRVTYDVNVSRFTQVEQVDDFLPEKRAGHTFVVMMNYGEYDLQQLPPRRPANIDGIRVAFHKKDMLPALEWCKAIKRKGYQVFVQAMVSLGYSDEEFLELIHRANVLQPDAFYIVDSFGVMKRKDLTRLFYMVEHNLANGIMIGYHSHNNMQLAYSNAQLLVDIHTKRDLVLDASTFGMGRGAGNLNTELFVEYLNDNADGQYKLKPLLNTIDEVLNNFHEEHYWGYSLPNYLSAKHNSHPNYAGFLDAKQTLTVENIDEIFTIMDDDKRSSFDKKYIESLYLKYMSAGKAQEAHLADLKRKVAGKNVLIIAPGRSSLEEKDKIVACADKPDVISISINYDYPEYAADFIFLSNLRRYREFDKSKLNRSIVTSNIPKVDAYLQVPYRDLLNDNEYAADNAGMMLIKLLIRLGVGKVFLAGMDGYSMDIGQNYAYKDMSFYTRKEMLRAMNQGMSTVLREFAHDISIAFLTKPKFVNITEDRS